MTGALDLPGADSPTLPHLDVLMTCHNRVELTQRSLKSLANQRGISLTVYLNDDASSDGTAAMARSFPFVRVTQGSGRDYWAGGMRRSWAAMGQPSGEAVVLLNDDVEVAPDALLRLLEFSREQPRALWGASVVDPHTGAPTYGGYRSRWRWRPLKMEIVQPDNEYPVEATVLNGNILLVPAEVASELGGLSPGYTHGMADFDLSLRARRSGVRSIVAPGTWGTCSSNARTGTWRDTRLSRRERWSALNKPTGLPPREYARFCLSHGGPLGWLDWLSPPVRILLGK
jgi:GT2 family glycosyltransferase